MLQIGQNVADGHRRPRRLVREILPVTLPAQKGDLVVVAAGEHPRTTPDEALTKLRPLFPGQSVTAGTASGVNDGAAALILAPEAAVRRHGLTSVVRALGGAVAAMPLRVMAIVPAPVVERPLARLGLGISA